MVTPDDDLFDIMYNKPMEQIQNSKYQSNESDPSRLIYLSKYKGNS